MDSRIENFMEYSALPVVGGFAENAAPAWLWSSDGSRILWTNAAGAAFFGVRDLTALGNLTGLARSPAKPHIARIAESGPTDRMTIDRLRFYRGLRIMLLTCQCQKVELWDGNSAALIVAPDQKPPLKKDPLAAYADLFPDSGHSVFLLTPGGTAGHLRGPLAQGIAPLAAAGDERFLSTEAEVNGAHHDALLAALGETRRLALIANEPLPVAEQADETDGDQTEAEGLPEDGTAGRAETEAVATPRQENAIFAPFLQSSASQPHADASEAQPEGVPQESPAAEAEVLAEPASAAIDGTPEPSAEAPVLFEGDDEEPEEETQPAPETEPENTEPAFRFEPRGRPSRFAWQMDLEQRFTFLSPEFAEALGAPAADIVGKTWAEVAEEYRLDPNHEVARALARRDTWSGKTVLWPVTGEALRVPVDMTALPAFDRRRVFEGYRGFGVCRTGEARPDPLETGLGLGVRVAAEPSETETELRTDLEAFAEPDTENAPEPDDLANQIDPAASSDEAPEAAAGETFETQKIEADGSTYGTAEDDLSAEGPVTASAADGALAAGVAAVTAGAAGVAAAAGVSETPIATPEETEEKAEEETDAPSETPSAHSEPEALSSEPTLTDDPYRPSDQAAAMPSPVEAIEAATDEPDPTAEDTNATEVAEPAEEIPVAEAAAADETDDPAGSQPEEIDAPLAQDAAITDEGVSVSLNEVLDRPEPDAPLQITLNDEPAETDAATISATPLVPVTLSEEPEFFAVQSTEVTEPAPLFDETVETSSTPGLDAAPEVAPLSEDAGPADTEMEGASDSDLAETVSPEADGDAAASAETAPESLEVPAIETADEDSPQIADEPVGIASSAPLKPKEIETAVKTLTKEYDAAVSGNANAPAEAKTSRTVDLTQAETVTPDDQEEPAAPVATVTDLSVAPTSNQDMTEDQSPPQEVMQADEMPGPDIISDLPEPMDTQVPEDLSIAPPSADDDQTFMQIGEGLFGARLTEVDEVAPTIEMDDVETLEPVDSGAPVSEDLSFSLEQEPEQPQVTPVLPSDASGNGETLIRPAETEGRRESGRVIDFASRSANLVPVDTSRLSKPEKEAFRKIAEALGARLEGDFDTEDPPEHAEELAQIRAAEVPEAQPIDPLLLDRLPIGIAIVRDRDVLYANETLLALLGHADRVALVEAGGLEAIFVEDDELPDADRIEGTVDSPLKIRTAEGGCRPVDARMHSVPWNGGRGLMISITEKPDAASAAPAIEPDALEAAEALISEMDTVLETATDGVLELSREGMVLKANKSAEALFNASRVDIVGAPFTHFLAPESHRAMLDYLDGLSRNGVASILNDGREVIGRDSAGGLIPLFMTMGRIDQSGSEMRFCAVLRDITQWKTAEEELTHAKRQAEMASSQKSDFLAKISHEIRTPLNAIIGFSEVMMEERFGPIGNDRYKDYLKDIKTSGSHIMSLINDLLDLSKIEAGKLDLSFSAVSANDILRECVAIMQPQANRERVIIRASLPDQVPNVVADPRSLRQIALNLLSNAIKFNKSGGQVIISSAIEETGEVVLRFRDTGSGMSEKELNAALEPFRQVHTARHGGGTGLGLPLTKALVEANRAGFRIESTEGQGTLVEITFPSQRVMAE